MIFRRSSLFLVFSLFWIYQVDACTNCERLQFAYDINHTGPNTATVAIKIKTSSGTVDIGGLTFYLYYDDNETTVTANDDGAIVGSPLNFGSGNKSVIFHDAVPNPNVGITHTGYYFYQNVDDDLSGYIVNTTYTTVLTIDFDHTDGAMNYGGESFLASTCEQNALAWSDPVGDEFDVCVIGLQTQLLPIELSSFNAERQNGNAFLSWETVSESNASHFEVQRKTASSPWSNIGSVDSKGGIQQTANYSFIDMNVMDFTNDNEVFYRLKMVDRDLTYAYSTNELVLFELAHQGVKVYPNPNTGKFVIEGVGLQSVEIYNGSGRLMYQKELESIQKASEIDLTSLLSSGVYFVKTTDHFGKSEMNKLIIGM